MNGKGKFWPWDIRRKVHVGDMVESTHFFRTGEVIAIRQTGKPQKTVYDIRGMPKRFLIFGRDSDTVTLTLSREEFSRVYYSDIDDDGSLESVEP